jgi:hypothetical protein
LSNGANLTFFSGMVVVNTWTTTNLHLLEESLTPGQALAPVTLAMTPAGRLPSTAALHSVEIVTAQPKLTILYEMGPPAIAMDREVLETFHGVMMSLGWHVEIFMNWDVLHSFWEVEF